MVAAAFIDFKKALDSVSHVILEMKLERDFGIHCIRTTLGLDYM